MMWLRKAERRAHTRHAARGIANREFFLKMRTWQSTMMLLDMTEPGPSPAALTRD